MNVSTKKFLIRFFSVYLLLFLFTERSFSLEPKEFVQITVDKASLIKPLLLVDIEYINNAINTINQYYGSIDNYISDVLHITNIMKIQVRKIIII